MNNLYLKLKYAIPNIIYIKNIVMSGGDGIVIRFRELLISYVL